MMTIKQLFLITISLGCLFACKKGVDPVDGNNATVELRAGATKQYVTDDVTVNPNDSIFFDFTISSSVEMGFVGVQKNPVNQTAFLRRDSIKNASDRFSYSAVMKFRADSANGPFIYRIVAHTKTGNYIGHKDIIVTTATDFYHYTDRVLYVPDTTGKSNKCYMSLTDGAKTYSYTEASTQSAKVDIGYFFDTVKTGTVVNGHSIYALTATNAFLPYDISTWTKNATILKRATAAPSPTFPNIQNAGAIRTLCNTQLASGASNKVIGLSTTSPSNIVYFRTASGKNGVMLITVANGSTADVTSFIKLDVKIEK